MKFRVLALRQSESERRAIRSSVQIASDSLIRGSHGESDSLVMEWERLAPTKG